jgi:hypothetical protein
MNEREFLGTTCKPHRVARPDSPHRQAYADAGVSHFEIKFIYPTLERHSEMLQLFAREILPAFR